MTTEYEEDQLEQMRLLSGLPGLLGEGTGSGHTALEHTVKLLQMPPRGLSTRIIREYLDKMSAQGWELALLTPYMPSSYIKPDFLVVHTRPRTTPYPEASS